MHVTNTVHVCQFFFFTIHFFGPILYNLGLDWSTKVIGTDCQIITLINTRQGSWNVCNCSVLKVWNVLLSYVFDALLSNYHKLRFSYIPIYMLYDWSEMWICLAPSSHGHVALVYNCHSYCSGYMRWLIMTARRNDHVQPHYGMMHVNSRVKLRTIKDIIAFCR